MISESESILQCETRSGSDVGGGVFIRQFLTKGNKVSGLHGENATVSIMYNGQRAIARSDPK